ncbi:hypothetical protein Q8A67_003990 [Cirrhinus molitorella]|uniref:Uncharacterized protein n=1 Tax=Cirrhinus molitorella TaxID=172907 RepID=A0AA88QAX2_9TELE|nr:hypothetical protein Q8A67_003990 [Cirrhinus molitorella]
MSDIAPIVIYEGRWRNTDYSSWVQLSQCCHNPVCPPQRCTERRRDKLVRNIYSIYKKQYRRAPSLDLLTSPIWFPELLRGEKLHWRL